MPSCGTEVGRLGNRVVAPCGHRAEVEQLVALFVAQGNGNGKKPKEQPQQQEETDHKQSASEGKGHRNSKDGLYSRLKAEIQADPEHAYNRILGAKLTPKVGSREPVALCPFHDDARPSLLVNLEKATWCCDPCGKGGDAFGLAKELWNLDFKAAISRLAELLLSGYADKKAPPPKLVRTLRYESRDLDGVLKAAHLRHEYDDGSKRMPWDPPGIKRAELPLFGINRTVDSADGEAIIVCEGEKIADSLWHRRILAVGTVTGRGGTPCDESLKPLLRFKVYLWLDNDDRGRENLQIWASL